MLVTNQHPHPMYTLLLPTSLVITNQHPHPMYTLLLPTSLVMIWSTSLQAPDPRSVFHFFTNPQDPAGVTGGSEKYCTFTTLATLNTSLNKRWLWIL